MNGFKAIFNEYFSLIQSIDDLHALIPLLSQPKIINYREHFSDRLRSMFQEDNSLLDYMKSNMCIRFAELLTHKEVQPAKIIGLAIALEYRDPHIDEILRNDNRPK